MKDGRNRTASSLEYVFRTRLEPPSGERRDLLEQRLVRSEVFELGFGPVQSRFGKCARILHRTHAEQTLPPADRQAPPESARSDLLDFHRLLESIRTEGE